MMQTFIYDCTPHVVHIAFKFTGKERDAESGLDYFGARYYSSVIGRFMSPDYDDPSSASDTDTSNSEGSALPANSSMNSGMPGVGGSMLGDGFILVPYADLQTPQILNLYDYEHRRRIQHRTSPTNTPVLRLTK